MASAAEQLAANINFSALAKADELKKRLWFTLGALVVYRLLTFIPLPGINTEVFLGKFTSSGAGEGIFGMFNMFAGGAIERMAIGALNIMPYISASIIVQLLTSVMPTLEALKKEGESGRKIINQYTRYLTVVLAVFQSWGIAVGLQNAGGDVVFNPGVMFMLSTVITLTGGTLFIMWLGEQITSRGIGNGTSLIIMCGIVANLPNAISQLMNLGWTQGRTGAVLGIMAMAAAIVIFVVFMERSQRRIPIQYPKQQVGNRVMQGGSSFLPLKLNMSGVIPPIFASSLLMLPATFSSFSVGAQLGETEGFAGWISMLTIYLAHGRPAYVVLYMSLIIFFTFFYTAVVFNPKETADNLKKHGAFIQGIRPGEKTADFIDHVLSRLTVVGAAYLCAVCLLPEFMIASISGMPFYLGGTSLLIVVSVTMDTVAQVQGYLVQNQYEGLIKKTKLRGARR
ncbi:MAG: preprotein translocase subunit SecY [Methylobacteriaceae bacterium]|jgi:preprotein translocase subunit SecY|nr:preprotein translocase subunit SecY [Methylobacteriaceae bacterium]